MAKCLDLRNPSILVLSVDWVSHARFATSFSDGQLGVWDGQVLQLLAAHEQEAWTVHSPRWEDSPAAFFSGGDDSQIRWSCPGTAQSVMNRKIHSAGVTSILTFDIKDILITGSYDGFLRILAFEQSSRFRELAHLDLGGGVWRLTMMHASYHGITSLQLLVSCMHAGARIVQVNRDRNETWSMEITHQFDEHESMNYASAFFPILTSSNTIPEAVIVSTSFYDRKLCVWKA